MNTYNVKIIKVIDGDTVDVDIELGFGVVLQNERIRIMAIDTPESRTSDQVEKLFGTASKQRLKELLGDRSILRTHIDKDTNKVSREKFGRVLGDFVCDNGEQVSDILVKEGYAVKYTGGNKQNIIDEHAKNRQKLLDDGKVSKQQYDELIANINLS